MKITHQIKAIFAGLLLSSSVVPVALAEDIEIYTTSGADVSGAKPNILFLIDGSLDMLATSTVGVSYDPDVEYPGSCSDDFLYYTEDGSVPDCDSNEQGTDFIKAEALVCDKAVWTTAYKLGDDGLLETDASGNLTDATVIVKGPLISSGLYNGSYAQYGSLGTGSNAADGWRVIDTSTSDERELTVECEADSGSHGIDSASAAKYIDDTNKYTATVPAAAHDIWSDTGSNLTLYSANYVNYLNDDTLGTTTASHFDQIREAIEYVVDTNSSINLGMMILDQKSGSVNDPGSEGGGIIYELQDGGEPRGNFIPQMLALNAEGGTPLSEAYYEALMYYGGKSVDYGTNASPPLVGSATESNNTQYATPIELSCQKNYIVVASNGKASDDDINATRQAALGADGFTTGQCSDTITPNDTSDDNVHTAITTATGVAAATSSGLTNDNCLDELAYWAANNDVAELAIDEHEGDQNITTHTIGFGYGDTSSAQQIAGAQLLEDTAEQGGGTFYEASSSQELKEVFDDIIAKALAVNSTFSSPAVSVNAFNRSTHLDDLYFTLFKPTDGNHWEGNLKKYKLSFKTDPNDAASRIPFISDQNGDEAIDATTGFFIDVEGGDRAQSFWSADPDGKEVAEGGAANEFDSGRKVFTYTGDYSGIAPEISGDITSMLMEDNIALTDEMLDITTETDNGDEVVTGTAYRTTLINWAAGVDALSDYGVDDTYDDVRLQMGDPLHAEPALVQYEEIGGTDNDSTVIDLVAYVATNDGYLHAFNVEDGSELWSFVPQELLPNLKIAMEDVGGDKLYGLDGSVIAWINDANNDGDVLDDGDDVYLYISMRRGGKNIYALKVTDQNNPELLWVIKGGEGEYTELGQTWSTVTLGKVRHSGSDKTVLIFGGGYDLDQDTVSVTTEDDEGRSVYIADAETGARLWTAGQDATTPTTGMNFSIPARINALDISGDGYTDRLYAVDMGGQVFRFDIDNYSTGALNGNIIGGRIADLADASTAVADRVAADARRFYYPPDVALINADDGPYHGLVLSSGYRAHPLDDEIHDRIYMLKDRNTSTVTDVSDYSYGASGPLKESDLQNATANLAGGDGANDATRDAELANITAKEGWYIYLDDEDNSGSWLGEKGLAEALIIEGTAIVTTYTPNLNTSTTSCDPQIGLGKIYFMNILDATAAFPSDLDARSERHVELTRGGIPPSPNVIITKGGEPTLCVGTECQAAEFGLGVRKTYWYEVTE